MSLEQVSREHRRLTILKHLEASGGYTSNVSILTDVANALGVPSSRDQLDTEVEWLAEIGLVKWADDSKFVVQIEPRGVEVAKGRSVVKGIKRPTVD